MRSFAAPPRRPDLSRAANSAAAAGVVLTEPGLSGIVACINEGRSAFQRVLTFALMTLVNKSVTLLVFGFGLIATGHAILTPFLQALAMLIKDFVARGERPTARGHRRMPGGCAISCSLRFRSFRLLYLLAILSLCWFTLRLSLQEMQRC